jgi:hypothetical protein
MILNANDYRRRAQALEQLARETPDPIVRKSLYSVAAKWRALADQAAGQAGAAKGVIARSASDEAIQLQKPGLLRHSALRRA